MILEAGKQEALDEAIISGDTSRLETIIGELKQIKENKLQPVRIFVNDVTAPAFAKTMESQGYVNLFDPDGVSWNEMYTARLQNIGRVKGTRSLGSLAKVRVSESLL